MARRRILIVEDEYFIAHDCAATATKMGFEVVGPFGYLSDALDYRLLPYDCALVDVKLCDHSVYPLLDRLLSRNIPVTLYTGYDRHVLPEKYASVLVVTKPADYSEALESFATRR